MVLRLFCNWIKTVNNWDQWPKLEKSTPHREAKKKFNRKQMKRAGIVNKPRFTWCVEKYRCEHCYVTTCNSIYNSFQITAKMRSNSDLMNRYHSQQTSIASYRWKQMELCVYELTKKGHQSHRTASLSTQSYLFFACLPFDGVPFVPCANQIVFHCQTMFAVRHCWFYT